MKAMRSVLAVVGISMLVFTASGCASRSDLDEARQQNIRVSDELTQERAERDQLKQQNAELMSQLEQARRAEKDADVRVADANDRLKASQEEGLHAKECAQKAGEELEEMQRRLTESQSTSAEMQKKLAEAESASATAQKQVSDLNAKLEANQSELNAKLQADETELRGFAPNTARRRDRHTNCLVW